MRVLHAGDDAHGSRAARPQSRPDRRRDPRRDLRPDLPLHGLRDDRALDPLGGRAPRELGLATQTHVSFTAKPERECRERMATHSHNGATDKSSTGGSYLTAVRVRPVALVLAAAVALL